MGDLVLSCEAGGGSELQFWGSHVSQEETLLAGILGRLGVSESFKTYFNSLVY